jgi:hypothetical protein
MTHLAPGFAAVTTLGIADSRKICVRRGRAKNLRAGIFCEKSARHFGRRPT